MIVVITPALTHQNQMQRSILFSVVACFAFSFATAVAQETEQETTQTSVQERTVAPPEDERLVVEGREKDRPAMRGLRPEREFQRRLPNGFAPLVNTTQREQIYKIQEEYYELIALLELRVELLKNERDVKIDHVLTPAQQQRLTRPLRTPLLPRVLGR